MKIFTSFFAALLIATALLFSATNIVLADSPAIFLVNDTGDDSDAIPGDGVCETASGVCTLRAALEESNALDGADIINLDLPNGSSISATADELLISDSVTINGPEDWYLHVNTGFNFHRVLRISPLDANAVIHITKLRIAGAVLPVGDGAGILIEGGTVYADDIQVQSNLTQNDNGGGIAITGGTLHLDHGFIANNTAENHGGGIYSTEDATVVISNTFFTENRATRGGGIDNDGQLTITDSDFIKNEAESRGGGIANDRGKVTLTGSTLKENLALTGGGIANMFGAAYVIRTTFDGNQVLGVAGALYNDYKLVISSSVIKNNKAGFGGGISNDGMLHLTHTRIEHNQSIGPGGGIYNATGDELIIEHSTFYENQAGGSVPADESGGAIYINKGNVTINNSTISGNSAVDQGGAIKQQGGILTINHSTIAFNGAAAGSGIYLADSGEMHIRNSINTNKGAGGDCHIHPANLAGFIAVDANLDSDGSCPSFTHQGQDPLLDNLQDNGGVTPTHALDANSPAVDAAALDGCMAVENVDQRGYVRIHSGESACDLGAYEVGGTEPPADEENPQEPPVDEEPVEDEPVEDEPVEEEPVDEEPVDEEPVDEEPVDEEPVDEDQDGEAPEEGDQVSATLYLPTIEK
jgi:predicted outer membrane repeat protein